MTKLGLRVALGVLIMLLLLPLISAAQQPVYGAPAPALKLQILQAPERAQATWASLRGNALVIEFWATWCAGCVAQIDHLNALTAQFDGKPVRFISVTDEDEAVVRKFINKHPIAGWIGIDRTGATFRSFGIEGRPQTALVDRDGVLRGIVPPTAVSDDTIAALIDGTLRMLPPARTPAIGAEADAPLPLVQFLVRPAMKGTGTSPGGKRITGNRFEAWALTMSGMIREAYGVPEWRMIAHGLPEGRYDVSIMLPDESKESRQRSLRHILEAGFGITAHVEQREVEVYVLERVLPGKLLPELASGYSLKQLVRYAEQVLDGPVVDETGLTGNYEFEWPEDKEALFSVLKNLGLKLSPARRRTEVLVVHTAVETRSE